jgi:DNA adenine methylase
MSDPIKVRPPVKWVGGKTGLLDQLLPLVPKKFDRYYEPFVGGGAMFFALQPERAMLSDSNGELMNVYFSIRDHVERVITLLGNIPVDEGTFYAMREENAPFDSPRRAARTIYLNKTCFNGLYRVNQKGEFNVSWGKKDPKAFPAAYDFENLRACSKVLQGISLWVADYRERMFLAGKGDFVYLDPPYAPVSKTSNFTSYTADKFGPKDQERVAEAFADLSAQGVYVMLSNADTLEMRKLYKGFKIDTVHARRNVNCDGAKRGKVNEIVVRNYGGKK